MRLPKARKNFLIGGGLAAWLVVVGLGLWTLSAQSLRPGASGHPGSTWPANTALPRKADGFTLVVVLHPECPCSQATLEELDAIMAQSRGQLAAEVLCVSYPDLPEPVEQSAIWRHAGRIPGVVVHKDAEAAEGRRFSALTSGEARLYGPAGTLLFHGGITGARGHAGENPGETAIVDFVLGRATARTPVTTPAFGCSL